MEQLMKLKNGNYIDPLTVSALETQNPSNYSLEGVVLCARVCFYDGTFTNLECDTIEEAQALIDEYAITINDARRRADISKIFEHAARTTFDPKKDEESLMKARAFKQTLYHLVCRAANIDTDEDELEIFDRQTKLSDYLNEQQLVTFTALLSDVRNIADIKITPGTTVGYLVDVLAEV